MKDIDFSKFTWRCHACGEKRQDSNIKIYKHDISDIYKQESGTLVFNAKYCDDKPKCHMMVSDRNFIIQSFKDANTL